jgi:protein FAM32A
MSFVGGTLKLKGGVPLQGAVKKKKKKSSPGPEGTAKTLAAADNAGQAAAPKDDLKEIIKGKELQPRGETEDRRTEAEKRFEQHQIKLEADRLKKLAGKSHRDRIKEFNEQLANLSVGSPLDQGTRPVVWAQPLCGCWAGTPAVGTKC